ncbi:hypothetical protein [Bacteroides sp.]|uniref:hypothetical protein n=1 Tax=Bacteroides sp. TaxID=29523 RepID=UPI002605BF8E|nr:hypothetical protein [Bacteroides sp.]MDD3041177.1 hypothetical protein [Bacteroides sp.]
MVIPDRKSGLPKTTRRYSMAVKATKNKIAVTVYVTPDTYDEIDRGRGVLKMGTYTAMVLEELFNPEGGITKCPTR